MPVSPPTLPPQPVMKFAELASEVVVQRAVQSARVDQGLMPGRRRANQLFKEVRRRLEEEGQNIRVRKCVVFGETMT